MVGPVISWPALNLGRVRAEVVAAQAREAAGRAEYSRVVLAAMEEMENALTRYRTARVRVERLRKRAPRASAPPSWRACDSAKG